LDLGSRDNGANTIGPNIDVMFLSPESGLSYLVQAQPATAALEALRNHQRQSPEF